MPTIQRQQSGGQNSLYPDPPRPPTSPAGEHDFSHQITSDIASEILRMLDVLSSKLDSLLTQSSELALAITSFIARECAANMADRQVLDQVQVQVLLSPTAQGHRSSPQAEGDGRRVRQILADLPDEEYMELAAWLVRNCLDDFEIDSLFARICDHLRSQGRTVLANTLSALWSRSRRQ